MKFAAGLVATALLLLRAMLPAHALVSVGQIDTFEDGTTQGWVTGSPDPNPPVNVSTGGPAGADDNYLRLHSVGGRGPSSRVTAFNTTQWTGDFTAAGITTIGMDVNNLGQTALALRLLFENEVGGNPVDVAMTQSVALPVGSRWTHVTFNLDPALMTAKAGTPAGALANVTEMRIFHSPLAIFPGPPIAATLGIDNIAAIGGGGASAIPEPSSAILFAAGVLPLFRRRLRTSRRQDGPAER